RLDVVAFGGSMHARADGEVVDSDQLVVAAAAHSAGTQTVALTARIRVSVAVHRTDLGERSMCRIHAVVDHADHHTFALRPWHTRCAAPHRLGTHPTRARIRLLPKHDFPPHRTDSRQGGESPGF